MSRWEFTWVYRASHQGEKGYHHHTSRPPHPHHFISGCWMLLTLPASILQSSAWTGLHSCTAGVLSHCSHQWVAARWCETIDWKFGGKWFCATPAISTKAGIDHNFSHLIPFLPLQPSWPAALISPPSSHFWNFRLKIFALNCPHWIVFIDRPLIYLSWTNATLKQIVASTRGETIAQFQSDWQWYQAVGQPNMTRSLPDLSHPPKTIIFNRAQQDSGAFTPILIIHRISSKKSHLDKSETLC